MKSKSMWLFFVLILVSDQLTKYWAELYLVSGVSVPIIPGLFDLTLVYNPGAAFGMFGGLPDTIRRVVLTVVSLIALAVVIRFMTNEARNDRFSMLALVSILSGAVGNMIDRFRYDSVVDFLDFYIGDYHWPAFNIADSAISVGVFVLMCRVLLMPKEGEAAGVTTR